MKANKMTPNFAVADITKTVEFYKELGFTLLMAVPESKDSIDEQLVAGKIYIYASMSKDNVEFTFQRTDSFYHDISIAENRPVGASISFYIETEDIDKVYDYIKSKKIKVSELKTAYYGMKEFYLTDINGYILGFAEKVE